MRGNPSPIPYDSNHLSPTNISNHGPPNWLALGAFGCTSRTEHGHVPTAERSAAIPICRLASAIHVMLFGVPLQQAWLLNGAYEGCCFSTPNRRNLLTSRRGIKCVSLLAMLATLRLGSARILKLNCGLSRFPNLRCPAELEIR
jgi:hypothetical protein